MTEFRWISLVVLVGCGGREIGDVRDVDTHVLDTAIADASRDAESETGTEVDADVADVEPSRPPFCAAPVPEQIYGEPGSCGLMDGFFPQTGCWFDYFGRRTASMLCDLAGERCTTPIAACADGWCHIPAASFLAGASVDVLRVVSPEQVLYDYDPPSTRATRRPIYVMDTEVTYDLFQRVMGYEYPLPLRCRAGGDCPAPFGSVFEAMELANRLGASWGLPPCYELTDCGPEVVSFNHSELTIRTCKGSRFAGTECPGLRLPTMSEAELVARAGTPYCFATGAITDPPPEAPFPPGDCMPGGVGTPMAWYCDNALRDPGQLVEGVANDRRDTAPQPVRQLLPNPFGVYDAQGNVHEFTQSVAFRYDPETETYSRQLVQSHEMDDWFGANDAPQSTGGGYNAGAPAACSMVRLGLGANYQSYALQVLGLRLVRTDLGDCETLRIPPGKGGL